ncbi:MAG: hypothetical protein UT55_C0057G0005 [Candidatus Peregrinibacteria bacterium GW2011_GWE2_39_6]|nr:MAG: hypothetical protein UT36_C0003G0015 [Candidatus Peregrinibacteria bacterium GW2011_GWF2_39_17]KKR24667.1 MAG: hypothetical protein UT55_C0057G0005 [Candidatus Peregrinibacteria bacterium GW2011_GWE2_39_6]HCW32022.1 hypothetical protein [Candidatus Peregrinibacteria bacterium]
MDLKDRLRQRAQAANDSATNSLTSERAVAEQAAAITSTPSSPLRVVVIHAPGDKTIAEGLKSGCAGLRRQYGARLIFDLVELNHRTPSILEQMRGERIIVVPVLSQDFFDLDIDNPIEGIIIARHEEHMWRAVPMKGRKVDYSFSKFRALQEMPRESMWWSTASDKDTFFYATAVMMRAIVEPALN